MRPPPLRDSLSDQTALAGGARNDAWPTLLVVDDDPIMLATMVCYFERRGFHVAAASNLAEAQTLFSRRQVWSLIISDYHLPDGTGTGFHRWLQEQRGGLPPFLLMSGSDKARLSSNGIDFLAKPFAIADLDARVQRLLQTRS